MSKRSSYEIKEKILFYVRESPASYAELERKVNTGFRTIKSNCEELENFGSVKISKGKKHSSNGKPYHEVRITKEGLKFLNKHKVL